MLLIVAAILAARKLAQYEGGSRVPATNCAISDAIRWANQIMIEIDKLWPKKCSESMSTAGKSETHSNSTTVEYLVYFSIR